MLKPYKSRGKMRRAMIMSGNLRGLSDRAAAQIRQHFDGDIFMSVWDREECFADAPRIDADALKKAFRPTKLEVLPFASTLEMMKAKYATFSQHKEFDANFHKNRKGFDSFCMLYLMERSWLLLKAHEEEVGQKYDLVVRFRPDYVFCGLPPDFKGEDNTIYFPSNSAHAIGSIVITDNLFLGNRAAMEKMMVMPALADTYLLREDARWCHENLVYHHLARQGIKAGKLNSLVYCCSDGSPPGGDQMSQYSYKKEFIVATILARDEEDIIADCIEHCLARGVDRIILTDNASVDATREIAARYKEVEIIDEPSLDYKQGEWMTRMARMAYKMGATWVVPTDADEFWEGIQNLRSVPANFGVVLADALYKHEPTDLIEEPFKRSQMPCFHREERVFTDFGIGRFCFRPYENVEVTIGGHGLTNIPKHLQVGALKELWLHHYPIRSYERYAKKIKNGVESLINGKYPDGVGQHWRIAYDKLVNGSLKLDYDLRKIKLKPPR